MAETGSSRASISRKLQLGLVLNTGFTIFEFIIGFLSGSLALVSDAAHNLTDSLALVVAFFANKIAARPANLQKTYGYGRASILAALLNALILVALAAYIFYGAYQRFQNPEPVEGGLVMIVAFVGILINAGVAFLFSKDREDLAIRSAFLSMALDALASIGALLAGLIIVVTGQTIVDPFISVLIGIMLLFSARGVINDALHVLLEGVPQGTDIQKVKQAVLDTPGVKGVDDLHMWAISSQYAALSCHVILATPDIAQSMDLKRRLKEMLANQFCVEHATIELEFTDAPHENERQDEGA